MDFLEHSRPRIRPEDAVAMADWQHTRYFLYPQYIEAHTIYFQVTTKASADLADHHRRKMHDYHPTRKQIDHFMSSTVLAVNSLFKPELDQSVDSIHLILTIDEIARMQNEDEQRELISFVIQEIGDDHAATISEIFNQLHQNHRSLRVSTD